MIDRRNDEVLAELRPVIERAGLSAIRFDQMLKRYLRDERGTDDHVARAKQVVCWYRSVNEGRPNLGVYLGAYYVVVGWQSWVEWSRKYLRIVRDRFMKFLPEVSTLVDLGCGLGVSTAAIRGIFPDARAIGTNLAGSMQWAVAAELAGRYDFDLREDIAGVDAPDLVFASEYFEHFLDPVGHLREVLSARPRVLVVANAFRALAVGHFPTYELDGERVSAPKIGRAFNAELRGAGYKMIMHGAWNNRPNLWIR